MARYSSRWSLENSNNPQGVSSIAFEIKQHDQRPLFVAILKDNYGESNEAAVDLTTATGMVFNMKQVGGSAVKISRGNGTITNAAAGEVTYAWGTADTDTAGTYNAEVEIAWADGKPETFPGGPSGGNYWEIVITPDIA